MARVHYIFGMLWGTCVVLISLGGCSGADPGKQEATGWNQKPNIIGANRYQPKSNDVTIPTNDRVANIRVEKEHSENGQERSKAKKKSAGVRIAKAPRKPIGKIIRFRKDAVTVYQSRNSSAGLHIKASELPKPPLDVFEKAANYRLLVSLSDGDRWIGPESVEFDGKLSDGDRQRDLGIHVSPDIGGTRGFGRR